MKKLVSALLSFVLMLSFAACGSNANQEEASLPGPQSSEPNTASAPEAGSQDSSTPLPTPPAKPDEPEESAEAGEKSLVVYFSWSGNTRQVAEEIQAQTGADLFEIVPETAYSKDYDTVLDLAQEEQKNNHRPGISGSIENVEQYDVIYVGYPNWWGDMPMILYTFFDSYDFSGKTIAPFCTSGGSGLSNTVKEIRELEPGATVTEGLHIGSASASNPGDAVGDWLSRLGV